MGTPRTALSPTNDLVFRTSVEGLHSILELREIHDGQRFSDPLSIHRIELPKRHRAASFLRSERDLFAWVQFLASETEEKSRRRHEQPSDPEDATRSKSSRRTPRT